MGYVRETQGLPYAGYNIGVLISERYLDASQTFYWHMYQELVALAPKKHCFVIFEIITEQMEEEGILPRCVIEKRVQGAVLMGTPGYDYGGVFAAKADLPCVFLDSGVTGDYDVPVDCVISDGFYGGYELTKYLLDRNHRDIAYVGSLFTTTSITDRYMGYAKALIEARVELRRDYILSDRFSDTGLRDGFGPICIPKPMPSAFVCNCDLTACSLIKQLQEMGLNIPGDVSVVGYDDFIYPGACDVPLTTYAVDIKEMVRVALAVLVCKLEGKPYKTGINIVTGHLVERASVALRRVNRDALILS